MTLAFQKQYPKVFLIFVLSFFWTISAKADTNADSLPFSQDWSNIALITANDDWSGVPSITGYRGDGLTSLIGADPQTIIAGDDALPVADVNVNNTTPNTFATGGVTEFHLADPVIALQGSGTADAPYIKIFLDTTNTNQIQVAYDVRDIDGSTDNAVQQVALHYRVGSSGNFTNLAGGYIADATSGSAATLVTHISVALPSAAENQPHVELRIMTANATGNDEWVGIDNISITANHAPTGVGVSPNSVLENKPSGTTVGTLTAADPDPTDTHTFALISTALCADNAYFSITGNTLTTAASFDFETKSSYSICAQVTDNHGLSKTASVQIDILDIADETPPSVTIDQAASQPDPTNLSSINFTVVFSEPVTNFFTGDVALSGTAGAVTATVTQITGAIYHVAVSGMTLDGSVIANVNAGVATDAAGNSNTSSTSADNQVIFSTDVAAPVVSSSDPASGVVLLKGMTQIIVQFSEEVKNDSSTGAANNAANFLLVASGADLTFETVSCLIDAAVTDIPIAINAAAYQNKITTLDINGGIPLSAGSYRLFICGTTSIEDLLGNKLNNGADDSRINFSVSRVLANSKSNWNSNSNLPATGFPVGRVTHLPVQTADKKYAAFSDLWLEIPKLTVSTPIVGVPLTQDGWDVTWLGQKAGWLNETAFPSWAGNSVITAHVWDAYNQPGIFYNLKDLQYGDLIKVHAFGQVYTYEVRETKQIAPNNFSAILKHEDKAWLTLLTCEDYIPSSQIYSHRRMVRAVWVSVASEK